MVAHQPPRRGARGHRHRPRPWPDAPAGVEMHAVDIRKRAAEDVFRKRRPDASSTWRRSRTSSRAPRSATASTSAAPARCSSTRGNYGVEHAIFVGRHTYYGAGPESPLYHHEDDPPMAVTTFPELADLVAADLYATTSLWRFPDLVTAVLRVLYTLGPTGTAPSRASSAGRVRAHHPGLRPALPVHARARRRRRHRGRPQGPDTWCVQRRRARSPCRCR
jgi:hypothetical protein